MAPRKRNGDSHADTGRLLISCPDRPGIVAAVTGFLFERGANVTDAQQHSTDPTGGTFFMRVEFELPSLGARGAELESDFAPLGARFRMDWRLAHAGHPHRLAVFVSRDEHALVELLWRQRAGDLRAAIALVVSNHRTLEETVRMWGVPFHHVPVAADTKRAAEAHQLRLLDDARVDTVVLARAVAWHADDRVLVYGNRTIVFS
ncbi:MAG TPA: ACT domain-containing protein [Chloroflexota bacterium]|nr:ACT domain-containing protein [Chloroflexota bacterium]